MNCKNCGAENKEDSKFCTSCGSELVVEKKKTTKKKEEVKEEKPVEEVKEEKLTYSQNNNSTTPNSTSVNTVKNQGVTDGKSTASLVLGICSFVIFCLMWPLSLIGLILGIASKERSGKRTAGIVLNTIALVISTIALIIVFVLPVFAAKTYSEGATTKTNNFFDELEEKLEEAKEEVEDELEETNEETKNDVKKVGDDYYGYVEVPESWVPFKDVDATTPLIQYTDIGEAGYIITLNVYEESIEADQAAKNLYNHIKGEGNSAYYLTTYIAGNTGYVVHATYTDNTYLDIYLFKASDNKLHYVAIEGPDKYNDNFNIPKTFSMTK